MSKSRFDIFNFFKEINGIEIIIPTKLKISIISGILRLYKHIKDEEYTIHLLIPCEDFKPFNTTIYEYVNNDLYIRISFKNYYYNLVITDGTEKLINFKIQKRTR